VSDRLASLEFGSFHLSSKERERIQEERGLSTDELLRHLVEAVKPFAIVPVSDFRVGSAGLNADGEIFLGVNLEFVGASFAQTVHAEQFLVSLSRTHSTSPLIKMGVSAPPCGHCRQFVVEFDPEGDVDLLIGDEPSVKMKHLLPRAFTPADLHVVEPFYSGTLCVKETDDLVEAARRAAESSYVPYSRTRSGIALRTARGCVFAGAAIENVAYNPGLPPLQAALVSAYAAGCAFGDVREVVLCQERGGQIDYAPQLRDLTMTLSDQATSFQTVFL
jgi:cytidine deaminase